MWGVDESNQERYLAADRINSRSGRRRKKNEINMGGVTLFYPQETNKN